MSAALNNNIGSYLTFKLGNELFAANVSKVLNILELSKITQIPRSPEYILGMINLRGMVLPVIDTRIKFGLPATPFTVYTCILVLEVAVENNIIRLGALVDSVQEVLDIDKKYLLPPPSIGNKYRTEFITSVYKKENDEFVMILDMDYIFSADEMVMLEQVQQKDI